MVALSETSTWNSSTRQPQYRREPAVDRESRFITQHLELRRVPSAASSLGSIDQQVSNMQCEPLDLLKLAGVQIGQSLNDRSLVGWRDSNVQSLTAAECYARLNEWKRYRGLEDVDGIIWPSLPAIQKTVKILSNPETYALPLLMSPDADGGVSLEWRGGNHSTRILIDEKGTVILRRFRDSRLIDIQEC